MTRKIGRSDDDERVVVAASTVVYTEADHFPPFPAIAYSAKACSSPAFPLGPTICDIPRGPAGTHRLVAYSLSFPRFPWRPLTGLADGGKGQAGRR